MTSKLRLDLWTRHARATLGFALTAFVLAACNSAEAPPVVGGVSAVSGDNQYATVGTQAANPLVVLVIDDNGNPFGSSPVIWKVASGGGTLADTTSTSNQSGYASMTYTAGTNPGVATIVATVGQFWTASFTIHIESLSSHVVVQRPRAEQ
jgi:hypothetical protein